MNRKLTAVLPLILSLMFAGAPTAQATTANQATPTAVADADVAGMAWVTSPWGFTDLYCVHHGWNCLRCSGTGFTFRYFWRGC
jgi:hypothetical protein